MIGFRSGASVFVTTTAICLAGAVLAAAPSEARGWKRLTLSKGSWGGPAYGIAIPPGIRGGERPGIDSAVASLRGRGLHMTFDYGPYGPYSGCEREADCSESREQIDGRPARIAMRERGRKISARIILAEGPTVDMFAECSSAAACLLAARMFRTISFGR